MYKKTVLINWYNGGTSVESFVSDNEITLNRVVAYYVNTQDFNSDKDSLEIMEYNPNFINLDTYQD